MKKLLFLGLLSLAAMSTAAGNVSACHLDGCYGYGCCSKNCCRPYNAFSPPCSYNCCCPPCGCCAAPCGQGCCWPQQQMPSCFCPSYGPGCCTSGCCDVGCLPAPGSYGNGAPITMPSMPGVVGVPTMPGATTGVPVAPLPQANPVPQFQTPGPQIFNQSSYMMPMQMPANYGYGQVQPVGYNGGYAPMYYPGAYQNAPMNYYTPLQAPSYWYGQ